MPPTSAPDPPGTLRGTGHGTQLWLARHAEVDEAWQGRAYGDLDVPLSDMGRQRTLDLARDLARMGPDRILSSPLSRALDLGRLVAAQCGAPLEEVDALREVQRGSWQGRAVSELLSEEVEAVRAFYRDPWSWRGHGGESDEMILARSRPALEEGLRRTAGGRLLVTTHFNVIRVWTAAALGIPPVHSFGLRLDPARIVVLRDAADGWHLVHSNLERPVHGSSRGGLR